MQWEDLKVKLEKDQQDSEQLFTTLLSEGAGDESNNM